MQLLLLFRSITKLMKSGKDDWSQYVGSATFAMNTSVQCTTKYTPFRMMYGREARFPLEAEKEEQHGGAMVENPDIDSYIEKIFEKQQAIFKIADEKIKASQIKQKKQYKKRKGVIDHKLAQGMKVLRRNMKQKTRKGSKKDDRWLGPYTIVSLGKTAARLKNRHGSCLKSSVNVGQLRPYIDKSGTVEHYHLILTSKLSTVPTGVNLRFPCWG